VDDQRRMARELAGRLAPFDPRAVVYLRDGGRIAAEAVGSELGVPIHPLDVRYPLSRLIEGSPAPVEIALLACKEIAYRLTRPRHLPSGTSLPPPGTRIALLDDSASSGRTIATALRVLEERGVGRDLVEVAVIRCGPRARRLVHHWILEEAARLSTRRRPAESGS
jgi:hypoxanthine phosphoribosyltransferase